MLSAIEPTQMCARTHASAATPAVALLTKPRDVACRVAAAGKVVQPRWAGDALLSKLVNALIASPVLFGCMKVMAKAAMRHSAQHKGVDWSGYVASKLSEQRELDEIKAELENPNVPYPSYYLAPFHTYEHGNLEWQAAYEVLPATYTVALRTYTAEQLTPQQALDKHRHAVTDCIDAYIHQHQLATPAVILDVGCSVGVSTRYLADHWPAATVTGMDLSPHFLAVAEQYERKRPSGRRIIYRHGLGESTGLPDHSVDMLSFQYVAHECPAEVLQTFIQEARHILRPGGVLFFADTNPRSKTIMGLGAAEASLLKATEPHMDSYFSYDLAGGMEDAGFTHVSAFETDHRHGVVVGVAA